MSETEIAIETLRLGIQKKEFELYEDLLKVGIPSLVAIISTILTYFIQKNNSKITLKITELNKLHEKEVLELKKSYEDIKESNLKKDKMYTELANHIIELHDITDNYLKNILTKKHLEKQSKPISGQLDSLINDSYSESFIFKKKTFNKIKSLILLLNHDELTEKVKNLELKLVSIYADCAYDTNLNFEQITLISIEFDKIRDEIFLVLSQLFKNNK